jgi:uncharacterized protein YdhG (YjbR/CyaY superfamily)
MPKPTVSPTDTAAEIDAILAGLPADQRSALQHLRETIRDAAPGAEEGMSYGTPAFRYKGRPLVSYGAAKAHCAFYCMSPTVMVERAEALADFDTSKGTIRFTPDRPLPDELVADIVRARMAETDSAAARR